MLAMSAWDQIHKFSSSTFCGFVKLTVHKGPFAGAGTSGALLTQIEAALIATEKLGRLTDPLRPELAMETAALRFLNWRAGVPGYIQTTDKNQTPLDRARDDIVQAPLRLVAAQLSAQPTQESQSGPPDKILGTTTESGLRFAST